VAARVSKAPAQLDIIQDPDTAGFTVETNKNDLATSYAARTRRAMSCSTSVLSRIAGFCMTPPTTSKEQLCSSLGLSISRAVIRMIH
jgi:hypothetical protein